VIDPIERAATDATLAMSHALNLWYGDVTLVLCNFARGVGVVVPGPGDAVAANALARARPAERAEIAARLLEIAGLTAPFPIELVPIDLETAIERLCAHLGQSQIRAPDAEARALLTVFADHRLSEVVGAGRRQIASTAFCLEAADGGRAALLAYVGDGP
jgi:hypothetical protein